MGLSVDGPRELHDTYRVDRRGQGTFDLVMRGWRYLRKHEVDFNILCTVNAANQQHGRAVYRFFRDELKAKWVQFIPIIERATEQTIQIANKGWSEQPGKQRLLYTQTGNRVTERTVGAEQYGRFLIDIFEEWVRHDVGQVYVQLFDVTLEAFFGRHLLCIHAPTCGYGPALEHNGDLYSCDHFVEPKYKLGNIHQTHMLELVASDAQRKFGQDKRDTLTPTVPQLQGAQLVQRRLPQGPLRAVARRRTGPELPVPGPGAVLHPHRSDLQPHGATAAAEPHARRRDGVGRRAGRRSGAPISPAPVAAERSSASVMATRRRSRSSAASTARRRGHEGQECFLEPDGQSVVRNLCQ